VDVANVFTGDVSEFGDEGAGECPAAGVFDAAEVTAGDVEEGEVRACFGVGGVVDYEVEEDEEAGEGDAGEDPADVSARIYECGVGVRYQTGV
jgi:hypothetical protein